MLVGLVHNEAAQVSLFKSKILDSKEMVGKSFHNLREAYDHAREMEKERKKGSKHGNWEAPVMLIDGSHSSSAKPPSYKDNNPTQGAYVKMGNDTGDRAKWMDCCKRCGVPGHGATACNTPPANSWCNRCKTQGHYWFYCEKMKCNKCGKSGHMKHHCNKTVPVMMISYDSDNSTER